MSIAGIMRETLDLVTENLTLNRGGKIKVWF